MIKVLLWSLKHVDRIDFDRYREIYRSIDSSSHRFQSVSQRAAVELGSGQLLHLASSKGGICARRRVCCPLLAYGSPRTATRGTTYTPMPQAPIITALSANSTRPASDPFCSTNRKPNLAPKPTLKLPAEGTISSSRKPPFAPR